MSIDKKVMLPDDIWDKLISGEIQTRIVSKLPQVKYKDSKTKVEYAWTDYTPLNEIAKYIFKMCLANCAAQPDERETQFTFLNSIDYADACIIEDILMMSGYTAEKKGKRPWFCGGSFFGLITMQEDGNEKINKISVSMDPEIRKVIGDLIKSKNGESVEVREIVMALVDDFRRDK